MDSNALMLVVASRKQLDVYANEHRFVSSFFNIGHTISLKELTTDEAIELSRLPTRSTNGAALSVDEQNCAQQWGYRHPLQQKLLHRMLKKLYLLCLSEAISIFGNYGRV
ncbi:hypothetical protein [Nostoc sp.]|uniref:hypothetical protein n=1 Tax=Nostoc sp. TaxID=1180 RepID=UPI002FEF2AB0